MAPKKIKILFTIPNFDTAGSGKAMLKIIQRLNPEIFEPHIACNHNRGAFFPTVEASGIPIHILDFTTSMKNKLSGFLKCIKMSSFYRTNHFDLVHSFHYSDDYSEALSVRMAGKKWVYVKKNMNWKGNSWKIRTALANGILAQNTDMIEQFFPGNQKVVLCSRGVDTTEFHPVERDHRLMNEFSLTEKNRIILAVANLVPVKGIEFLVDAYHRVYQNNPNAVLIIVGDDRDPYAELLKKQAAEKPGTIIFTGKRLDVASFHSICDVFVLPTLNKGRKEGSPVSFLEALASGSCSIGTNIPGIKDQLAALPNHLFEPENVLALEEKINWALSLDETSRKLEIEKQLEIIRQGFTIEQEVKRHEDFYLKVLGK